MPARQVPKNYCGLSGKIAPKRDRGVFPEYSLQKDLITLFEFDQRVISFEEQPLQIPFEGANGKIQFYVPDFRVSYRRTGPGAVFHQSPQMNDVFTWISYQAWNGTSKNTEFKSITSRTSLMIFARTLSSWIQNTQREKPNFCSKGIPGTSA